MFWIHEKKLLYRVDKLFYQELNLSPFNFEFDNHDFSEHQKPE